MSFRVALFLLLFCCVISATAQKFQPGYYIKLTGDTVRTDLYAERKFGTPIGFQSKDGRLIGPLSVKGFGISKETYVSKIVSVDKSPSKKEITTDTAFLEVLAKGKISLLYYRDEAPKAHFFIQHEDGSLEELGLKIFDLGDHKQFSKLTTYKDVLRKNFPLCTELFSKLDKTPYDRKNIQSIFLELYKCKFEEEPSEFTPQLKTSLEFGVIAGFVQNSISFKNNAYSPYPHMTFSKSGSGTGGVYLNVHYSKVPFMFIRNELLFSYYESSAPEVVYDPTPSNERRAAAGLKNSYLRYNLLFRKDLGENNVIPFINVGGSFSVLMSHSGYQTDIRANYGSVYFNEEFPFAQYYSKVEVGFLAGLGATVNKFSFEARYELSSGIKPVDYSYQGGGLFIATLDPASPVNSFYFLISYKLSNFRKSKGVK